MHKIQQALKIVGGVEMNREAASVVRADDHVDIGLEVTADTILNTLGFWRFSISAPGSARSLPLTIHQRPESLFQMPYSKSFADNFFCELVYSMCVIKAE